MFHFVRTAATLFAILFLIACSEPSDPVKEAEVERLRAEVEELASTYSSLLKEKELLRTQNNENESLIRDLDYSYKRELETRAEAGRVRDYVNALESADSQLRDSLDAWRKATRESFIGRKIPVLALLSGASYSDVMVVEVFDDSFTVEEANANRIDIPFTDVSEQVRSALVYEPTILARDSASLIVR